MTTVASESLRLRKYLDDDDLKVIEDFCRDHKAFVLENFQGWKAPWVFRMTAGNCEPGECPMCVRCGAAKKNKRP